MGETIDWKTISLAKKDGSKVEAEEGLKVGRQQPS